MLRRCTALLMVQRALSTRIPTSSAATLSALSVSELKRLLIDRNIDFRGALEKRELVDLLVNAPPLKNAQAAAAKFAGLTAGEDRMVS